MTSLTIHMGTEPVGYFIAPDGSDVTGDGSINNPWATIRKFYGTYDTPGPAAAGDTLYLRGGTYSFTGLPAYAHTIGTALAPITVRNYPGETPLIANPGNVVIMYVLGAAHHILDGVRITNWDADEALWVGGDVLVPGDVYTGPVTIRNCYIEQGPASNQLGHGIYVSWMATDVTVEYCTIVGRYSINVLIPPNYGWGATGVHRYHDPCGYNTVVDHCILDNWCKGALHYDNPTDDSRVTHCTFTRNYYHLEGRRSDGLLYRDNAGDEAIGSNIHEESDTNTTADHNFWAQTFQPGTFLLAEGQSGRGAASDGFDAGALDW